MKKPEYQIKDRRPGYQRQAEAVTPWRCAGCNMAIVPGRNTPCNCTPKVPA